MNNTVISRALAARVAAFVSVAPDLALASTALVMWVSPTLFPHGTMRWLGNVLAFEFVMLHAAGFMIMSGSGKPSLRRWLTRGGLLALYTALAAWISFGIGAWWPIVTFAVLLINQFLPLLRDELSEERHRRFAIRWITATFVWLGATLVTAFVPLPRFGLTEPVVATLGPGGDGLWEKEPHRLMVALALYFGIVAAIEMRAAYRLFVSREGTLAPGYDAISS